MSTRWDFSTGTLPSGVSATSATPGPAWNNSGNLAAVAANTPRWCYDPTTVGHALLGIIVRPAIANIAPNPNTFSSWSNFNLSSGPTQNATGPDGVTNSAWSAANAGYFGLFEATSFTTTHKYSLGVFQKWGGSGSKQADLVINGALTGVGRDVGYGYDVTTGTPTATYDTTGVNGGPFTSPDPTLSSSRTEHFNNGYTFGAIGFTSVATTTTNIAPFWDTAGSYSIFGALLVDWGTGTAGTLYSFDYTSSSTTADQVGGTAPAGATAATITFDDNSTQSGVSVTGGASWTIPTNLNRPIVKYVDFNDSSVSGSGAAVLTLTASASGAAGVAGNGAATLVMTASASGAFNATVGTGAATFVMTASASGTVVNPVVTFTGVPYKLSQPYLDANFAALSATVVALVAQTTMKFVQTASKTVTNTTSETTLLSTGVGTAKIPANTLTTGSTVAIVAMGVHTASGNPNIRMRVYLGSTVILDTGVVSSSNSTNALWELRGFITCRSPGASGSLVAEGFYTEAGGGQNLFSMSSASPVTIDTTADQTLNVTVQWGTASASDSITCTLLDLQQWGAPS